MKKTKASIRWKGFAILNANKGLWSEKVFETEDEAERYMKTFWGGIENPDMSKHQVVLVEIIYLTPKKNHK